VSTEEVPVDSLFPQDARANAETIKAIAKIFFMFLLI